MNMRKEKLLVKILKLNKLEKTVDEDPVSHQRWISERTDRLDLIKIEFGKPKDYCKAGFKKFLSLTNNLWTRQFRALSICQNSQAV